MTKAKNGREDKEPNIPAGKEQHGRGEKRDTPKGRHEKHDVGQREREAGIGYSARQREGGTKSQLREPQVPTKAP